MTLPHLRWLTHIGAFGLGAGTVAVMAGPVADADAVEGMVTYGWAILLTTGWLFGGLAVLSAPRRP